MVLVVSQRVEGVRVRRVKLMWRRSSRVAT